MTKKCASPVLRAPSASEGFSQKPYHTHLNRQLQAYRDQVDQAIAQRFGVARYRPLQREAITAALAHRDSLVVMPTGGGKSLCYQAPAAMSNGLTIVVSPLIALMEDQVHGLNKRGISAAAIHSNMTVAEQQAAERLATGRQLNLLYVSPERAITPQFLAFLSRCDLTAFVIDEAHCVIEWGYDFRPAYAGLADLRKCYPIVPIHAFTATATPAMRTSIHGSLHLSRDTVELVGNVDRPNLFLQVERRDNLERQLERFVALHVERPGIIYAMRRADTEAIVAMLIDKGFEAAAYHAGMSGADRRATQDAFMLGTIDVIVATVAFGMGIDRPDVGYVVHAQMPSSIDMYHQEIGRAGRDGTRAECVVFYDSADADCWLDIFEAAGEDLANKETHVSIMDDYCHCGDRPFTDAASGESECRHGYLRDHFTGEVNGYANCGMCDLCVGIGD